MCKYQIFLLFSIFVFLQSDYDSCNSYFNYLLEGKCSQLLSGNLKRCVFNENKCRAYYDKCEDFTLNEGVNEEKCKANIPSDPNYKCIWDSSNSKCIAAKRKCNDYPIGYPTSFICYDLETSDVTNKICIETELGCEEQYKTCELYNSLANPKTKEKCESIRYYNENKKIFEHDEKKCVFSGNTCSMKYIECSDMADEDLCLWFSPSDSNKRCIYSGNICNEQYKTCYLYDKYASNKNEKECKNIKLYDNNLNLKTNKVCDFINSKCQERHKKCSEYLTQNECENNSYNEFICVYKGNKCMEQYKTCELYDQYASNKNENECKNIKLYDEYGNLKTKTVCDFINSKCQERPKKCSEYLTQNECEYNIYDDFVCVYKNNKCVEQYKTCELYEHKASNKNPTDCKAIKIYTNSNSNYPFDDSKICDYTGNACSSRNKECKDMVNEETCLSFSPSDPNKRCIYSGNICKEQYKTCDLYDQYGTSKNEAECKAIQETEHTKCTFDTNSQKCLEIQKECSELTSETCTLSHTLTDTNKKCSFINNECIEQYKTCELYDSEVDTKSEIICNKIIPNFANFNFIDSYSKCVFDKETSKCERKKKKCEEITDSSTCTSHTPSDFSNKICAFENNQCKEVYKSCSYYNNDPNKNEEGCKAVTYRNSQGVKDYGYKCIYDENQICKEQRLRNCEDYEPILGDTYYCTHISDDTKGCIIQDNKCVLKYKKCPGSSAQIDNNTCTSIEHVYEYKKCVIDEKNNCVEKYKECTEYKGTYQYYCENLAKSYDENKKCFYENDKCVSKYIYCEGYTGNDRTICESIIPYDKSNGKSLEDNYKCIMETDGCKMTEIPCKDTM